MIEVQGLSKFYGNHRAIDEVSFKIKEGETVGLLGLNGAGKSTILKILATYLAPSAGSIKVGGFDYKDNIDSVRKIIGYLPDSPPLYNEMRVAQYLEFAGQLKGVSRSQIDEKVHYAMASTSLSDVAMVHLGHLSHGYRQRVGIAQAILHQPDILIFDEPINGLDPIQIVEMRDLILSFKGKYTVILSSHILSEITQTCDQILILDKGNLVAVGKEDLLHDESQVMTIHVVWNQCGKEVVRQLNEMDGVERCEVNAHGEIRNAEISLKGDKRAEIAATIVHAGNDLLSMTRKEGDLESLFMKLVNGGDRHV